MRVPQPQRAPPQVARNGYPAITSAIARNYGVTMRAVIASKGKVSVVERDIPSGPGELITVTSSGICGSDLHMIELNIARVVLGHEFGGYTEDGRLVAVRPTGECGSCVQCKKQHFQTCESVTITGHGLAVDGGLADFVRVDASRLFEMPKGMDAASVGLIEPLAVVTHGVNRVNPPSGSSALVVGAGSIGLLAGAVLKDRGLDVHIVARHPHQIQAAEALGLRMANATDAAYEYTFDAVCTQQSFDQCVNATVPGGTLVEFGMFWTPVSLNNTLMLKEITVVPSMYYGHNHEHHDFMEAIDHLYRHQNLTNVLVTHRFALEDATEAFRVASDRKSGAIKVHVFPTL